MTLTTASQLAVLKREAPAVWWGLVADKPVDTNFAATVAATFNEHLKENNQ